MGSLKEVQLTELKAGLAELLVMSSEKGASELVVQLDKGRSTGSNGGFNFLSRRSSHENFPSSGPKNSSFFISSNDLDPSRCLGFGQRSAFTKFRLARSTGEGVPSKVSCEGLK